jgi:SAM-dependent methyltransferase
MTRTARIKEIRKRIDDGTLLTDAFFDRLFSPKIRALSGRHWTSCEIALRAAGLLVEKESDRILDIGSGAGKFCVLGALSTKAHFVGMEIRAPLIQAAIRLREEFDLEKRIDFIEGDATALDWSGFTGFYMFNPFYEHIASSVRMEPALEFGMTRFEQYVRGVQKRLREAKIGTKVAIFHGFGGGIPQGYRRVLREEAASDFLDLWVKKEDIPQDDPLPFRPER